MSAPQFTKDAAGAKNSMHAAQQQAQNQAENIGARESKHVSHATGKSKLPEGVQKAVPEKVERIVPNKIHDTGEARVTDPNSTGWV